MDNDPAPKPMAKKLTISDLKSLKPVRIQCDPSMPSGKIQIVMISGKKEAVTVNMTCSVQQIYAHCKALSGLDEFKLTIGMPAKELVDFGATVESAGLKGTRISMKPIPKKL